jgi:hypothetical protein
MIDDLYASFVATLPEALIAPALGLASTLGLAPSRAVPWSEVFSNEITLGAPRLVAEAMPDLAPDVVRRATLAHLLAVIEAFGTDRIEDGQTAETPALAAVLAHARAARDAALAAVLQSAGDARVEGWGAGLSEPSYARAEREALAAIRAEQAVLRTGDVIAFDRYLDISHGKQRVGLPASLALARVAGWDARRARCLARLLDAVWVALQLHDDVIDWEDDFQRGGAWAPALAAYASSRIAAGDRPTMPLSVQKLVHQSGALARMLAGSARRFKAARRRAEALGAHRLAAWAREREETTRDLARREAESPGFANRSHALSHWVQTVLP